MALSSSAMKRLKMAREVLEFEVLAECKTTKARVAEMRLPHHTVNTPVFMPVSTLAPFHGSHRFSSIYEFCASKLRSTRPSRARLTVTVTLRLRVRRIRPSTDSNTNSDTDSDSHCD